MTLPRGITTCGSIAGDSDEMRKTWRTTGGTCLLAADPSPSEAGHRFDVVVLPLVSPASVITDRAPTPPAGFPFVKPSDHRSGSGRSDQSDVARRLAREADSDVDVEAIFGDVLEAANAARFTDVDYLFLARRYGASPALFNAIVHQFLVPGVQLGSNVSLSATTGRVLDVHSVVRPVTPDEGCLWCNALISPKRLAEEALSERERAAQRYVDDPEVAAPSVITLNAAANAATDFLFAVTGLVEQDAAGDYLRSRPRVRDVRWDRPRRDLDCPESGLQPGSRFARGDGAALPVRIREPRP